MSGGIAFDQTTQALMDLQKQIDALSEQLRSFRLMFWRHLQEHHKESLVPNAPGPVTKISGITRTWEVEGS